ncbi:uncharacterized protein LOC123650998 isoform X3 [Pipistrellus kuhlii]|uniref:uncharacterized protein LOC123650998 isoform X3 n=1 Tax=Pipistrellus kuhlii TaxID=59472 RepID=UPI00174F7B72|nr:uncharacterized protein LOC123650998 isoform X3 [Pipistrellus kuhlii]
MKPLSLLLAVALGLAGAVSAGPAAIECWFVEDAGGGRLAKRPAALLLRQGPGAPPPRPDLDPKLYLRVHDPAGALRAAFRRYPAGAPAPHCEMSRYVPLPAPGKWVSGLAPGHSCPRALDGPWFMVSVSSPVVSLSSLLRPQSEPQPEPAVITEATAVLTVVTHTPTTRTRLGQDALLDLSFAYTPPTPEAAASLAPGPPPFGLEWRHQHQGKGHLLLAATPGLEGQMPAARDGAVAFAAWDDSEPWGPWTGNGTLRLPRVQPRQEGAYLATVHLSYLQGQVALELAVQKPPKVSLTPAPLVWAAPGEAPPELLCLVSNFYPAEGLKVEWELRGPDGSIREAEGHRWLSALHHHSDGSISLSGHLQPAPVTSAQHGARYACRVHHPSLPALGRSAEVTLEVAGRSGPSLEDGIGLFLSAFLVLGLLKVLCWAAVYLSASKKSEKEVKALHLRPILPFSSIPVPQLLTHGGRLRVWWQNSASEECRVLRNFSSVYAVVSALQSSPIHRLRAAWGEAARDSLRVFSSLCQIFSEEDNYSQSRELLLQGVVPYLGTFLKDLVMLDAASKDELANGYINFDKRRKEFAVLSELRRLQNECRGYDLRPDPNIQQWLQGLRPLTEAQSHRVSCEVEPPGSGDPPAPRMLRPTLVISQWTEVLGSVGGPTPLVSWDRPSVGDEVPGNPAPLLTRLAQHMKWPSVSSLDSALESSLSLHSPAGPSHLSPPASSPRPSRGHRRSASCGSPLSGGAEGASRGPASGGGGSGPGASDCRIIRVQMELGEDGSVYKSILVTSQDKAPSIISRVLKKNNRDSAVASEYELVQLLPGERELSIPPSANVFYAMDRASHDFLLRQRRRSSTATPGLASGPSASGTPPSEGGGGSFPRIKATGRKIARALF